MCSYVHALMTFTAAARLRPRDVSRYSTVTGTVGYTVRVIRPSRSRPRKVWVSTFWVIPSTRRRSSENRGTPSADSALTTSIVHLSATRPRIWRVGHAALMTFHRQAAKEKPDDHRYRPGSGAPGPARCRDRGGPGHAEAHYRRAGLHRLPLLERDR